MSLVEYVFCNDSVFYFFKSCEYAGKETSRTVSDADYELAPQDGPAADTVNAAGVPSTSGLPTSSRFLCLHFLGKSLIVDTPERQFNAPLFV